VASEFTAESVARFWARVNKTADCWLWMGPTNGRYGRIGRRTYAHRASFEIANGPIPPGLFVLHRCDTPLCVRPDHLFLGTAKENSEDAVAKRRQATGDRHGTRTKPESRATGIRHGTWLHPETVNRGEDRPAAKLTEEQVRQIRMLSDLGETRALLARRYGVTTTVIRRIANREGWRHVR
jgi:hypothetical protein